MNVDIPFKDPQLISEFEKNSRRKHFDNNEVIIGWGQPVVNVPVVISGSIRVMREDKDGNEIFLYHIYPGQTCAMSLNCCQADKASSIKAVAEDETEVYLLSARLVDDWFRFKEWKEFVNSTYSMRFNELLQVIDLIAFSNMDKQLLHYLQERARALNTKALYITHQQIADELRTHREAISRLLRAMETKGIVRLGRNTIELLY
jgi:CRP/FNR family transcriptional regulator